MRKPQIKKYERAAAVLLDALYTTDQKAAERYGVSLRSVQGWRRMLAEDSEFAAFFATKKEQFDAAWADTLPIALKEGVGLLAECARAIRSDARMMKNPAVIAAVAGAVKICAEVYLTGKVIDARIAGTDRQAGQVPLEGDTAAESQYAN
jgi:hypothetical protein